MLCAGLLTPGFDPGSLSPFAGAAPMNDTTTPRHRSQITGNAGLNYAAWQLSRRGWHVMPTIRNAKGSDMIVTDADETVFFGVQSKGFSKRWPVPLGLDLGALRSDTGGSSPSTLTAIHLSATSCTSLTCAASPRRTRMAGAGGWNQRPMTATSFGKHGTG